MKKSVIIFGPQGIGKNLHAEELAVKFGLTQWKDWQPGEPIPPTGWLLFATVDPRHMGGLGWLPQVISFDDAMGRVG